MKRSTSILLCVLLPHFLGACPCAWLFHIYVQPRPRRVRPFAVRPLSAPEAGFVLSVDQASLSLFPRPAASVSGLTIRTPAMTLFVDEGAVYPDLWALLHGETHIAGVRLLKPALLLEPPTGTMPETLQQPQFSIPPQLAEMEIDVEDGTVAYLLPGTNKSGLHPSGGYPAFPAVPPFRETGTPVSSRSRWARWNGTETAAGKGRTSHPAPNPQRHQSGNIRSGICVPG